jgi:hypothetical protein
MFRRAFPIATPEITLGDDCDPARSSSAGAILHGIRGGLARVLRALGTFFAAGGALS